MQTAYLELEAIFRKALTLKSVASLLSWDAQVMMPSKSYLLRASQFAALDSTIHELITSNKTSLLLSQANAQSEQLTTISQRNLALMTRYHQRNTALPTHFVEQYDKAVRMSEHAWYDAKKHNDFAIFKYPFAELITLVREKAQRISQVLGVNPFEALMDEYDPHRKQLEIDALFNNVKPLFPDLIAARLLQPLVTPTLSGEFSKNKQLKLCQAMLADFSFSLDNGRLDESIHPFTEGAPEDIRMTVSFDRTNPLNTILGLVHELGHGLYDSALPADYRFTLVGQDAGMAMHEGLALFWEKCIGTSMPFVMWLSKLLPEYLGESNHWHIDNLYALLTQVNPQKPRIESDELCYMAHVLIRYETEKALFSNEITSNDVPAFWQSLCQKNLGIQVDGEKDCLQDIHWAQGYFGYFQSYGIGFIFATQLHYVMQLHHPEIYHHIATGNMVPLVAFLKHAICQHGARYSTNELIEKATHQPLQTDALIHYLKTKYIHVS